MTKAFLLMNLEYLLRLILAAFLGGAIGIERELRLKDAGVRTHLIVALSACLMMLVSKYGFTDIQGIEGVVLDPSRVAAAIVSGVGFLGAGVIFTRGGEVNGLTTAAGVWATVGVGMAAGAGMYVISVSAAVLVLILQLCLHRPISILRRETVHMVHARLDDTPEAVQRLCHTLEQRHIAVLNMRVARGEDDSVRADLEVQLPPGSNHTQQLSALLSEPYIRTIEW